MAATANRACESHDLIQGGVARSGRVSAGLLRKMKSRWIAKLAKNRRLSTNSLAASGSTWKRVCSSWMPA